MEAAIFSENKIMFTVLEDLLLRSPSTVSNFDIGLRCEMLEPYFWNGVKSMSWQSLDVVLSARPKSPSVTFRLQVAAEMEPDNWIRLGKWMEEHLPQVHETGRLICFEEFWEGKLDRAFRARVSRTHYIYSKVR